MTQESKHNKSSQSTSVVLGGKGLAFLDYAVHNNRSFRNKVQRKSPRMDQYLSPTTHCSTDWGHQGPPSSPHKDRGSGGEEHTSKKHLKVMVT